MYLNILLTLLTRLLEHQKVLEERGDLVHALLFLVEGPNLLLLASSYGLLNRYLARMLLKIEADKSFFLSLAHDFREYLKNLNVGREYSARLHHLNNHLRFAM